MFNLVTCKARAIALPILLSVAACSSYDPEQPVVITVIDTVVLESPNRLGINIGESTYFGDQQISSALLPHGDFSEGQQARIIRNKVKHENVISDKWNRPDKPHRNPSDSFEGGTYHIASGPRAGETGTIVKHTKGEAEFTLEHSGLPIEMDDLIWVKSPFTDRARPSNKYDQDLIGIGDFRYIEGSEGTLHFIPNPERPLDQVLEFNFEDPSKDSTAGIRHFFTGTADTEYVARVRARSDITNAELSVSLSNLGIRHRDSGHEIKLKPDGSSELTSEWTIHTFRGKTTHNPDIAERFSAVEFKVHVGPGDESARTVQIDWVELEDNKRKHANGFNAKLLPVLEDARPGILRFYKLASQGATIDSIAARSTKVSPWKYVSSVRGYSMQSTHGVLDNCLNLSRDVGANPWVVIGGANDPSDWYKLISYVAAPKEFDEYSRQRASHGYDAPWIDSFDTLYLEIGNEWWNTLFKPFHVWNADNYGELCNSIIRVIHTHPHFPKDKIKIIVGGWAANARNWNAKLDKTVNGHDYISLAPYLLHRLDKYATDEEKYGTLLADVDGYRERAGRTVLKELAKNNKDTRLAIYELNTHLTEGEAPPSVASEICTSHAAGIAVLDMAMTLMKEMNTDPVTYFTLLKRADGVDEKRRLGLWGNLLRENDGTFRARPVWEGLRLANKYLIQGDMVEALVDNTPTRAQEKNGSVPAMKKVPAIHAFGFADVDEGTGKRKLNLLVLNRSLGNHLPLKFNLPFDFAPEVRTVSLSSTHYADNNEVDTQIRIQESDVTVTSEQTVNIEPYTAVVFQFRER